MNRYTKPPEQFTWFPVQEVGFGEYQFEEPGPKLLAGVDYQIAYEQDKTGKVIRVGYRAANLLKPKPRPSFDEIWVDVAQTISKRGTCPRRQVGAVLVDEWNDIVSTGYNGSPRGLPHCSDVGCLLDDTGRCKRTAHAEANAIIQAGKEAENGTLYVTDFPCSECANLIIQGRLKRVVYVRPYESQPKLVSAVTDMFVAAGVQLERWKAEGGKYVIAP
jgi:dCMP deaminase